MKVTTCNYYSTFPCRIEEILNSYDSAVLNILCNNASQVYWYIHSGPRTSRVYWLCTSITKSNIETLNKKIKISAKTYINFTALNLIIVFFFFFFFFSYACH